MDTNTQWPRNATVYAIDDDDSFRHSILRLLVVAGLQSAGYATDPAYSGKLLKVAHGPSLAAALSEPPHRVRNWKV